MKRSLRQIAGNISRTWRGARLSRVFLGKHIIMFASTLHLGWATLLLLDSDAKNATALNVIVQLCGGRYRAAAVLIVTAIAAAMFPFTRRRITNVGLALMLLPQQSLLLMSAGAGLYATTVQHYADGVARAWPFILADQLPVILASVLYTIAVIESAFEPPSLIIPEAD